MELDQRMSLAFQKADKGGQGEYTDSGLFASLLQTNPALCRYVALPNDFVGSAREWVRFHYAHGYLRIALGKAAARTHGQTTLGVVDFLCVLIDKGMKTGDDYSRRPYSVDLLTQLLYGDRSKPLSECPEARAILEKLKSAVDGAEDFQYILAQEGGRVVFRVVSVLDDYVQDSRPGIFRPQRALLTHIGDEFGLFTEEEIRELEDLLNSKSAQELDFQRFFEGHQHFLRQWDYREVHSHVTLYRPEGGLIPDFILTDRELQKAAILDLKLPKAKLIRRQDNRERFADSVMEARSQLLRYRDWFTESKNRQDLKDRVGMTIYEPDLMVIIGRSSEFVDEFDRQRLHADNPEIEVVTYDDILTFANRRRMIIRGQ